MVKIIKLLLFSFFLLFVSIFLFLLADMTSIDKNYLNRSFVHIDVKNLNSSKSFRLVQSLRNYYFYYYELLSPKSFNKRWSIESLTDRLKYPEKKIIYKKNKNFSNNLYSSDQYASSSSWYRSHGNNFSTRFSNLDQITPSNVSNLKLAWQYKSKISMNSNQEIQANSIFDEGVIYTADTENNVVALDAQNGKKIWGYKVNKGIAARRGLILWKSANDGVPRLFFTNNRDKLFSIDSTNGKPIKSFGKNGHIKIGLTPLPPIIYKDDVFVVTTDSVIKSYNIYTGKINWKYKVNKTKNSFLFNNFKKGSPWGGFSLDEKRGVFYFTTGNPEPWYVGVTREGDNLYANSLVAFDLNKKKIIWHFQEIPHDVWNMDWAAPPILTMIKRNGKNIDVVVGVTKLGNTFVLDRDTGEPLFDIPMERAPTSNIPGERTSPYQTNITTPEPVCRNRFKLDYLTEDAKKSPEFIEILKNAEYGFPTPPQIGKKNIQIAACVRWAGASVDSKNNILYVSVDQNPDIIVVTEDKKNKMSYSHRWELFVDQNGTSAIKPPWGAIVALNLNTGKILWKIPFGENEELKKKGYKNTGTMNRAGLTATSGNIIFASGTWDNKIRAFDSNTGQELWSEKLPAPGSSPPTVYRSKGKDYVLISAYENGGNTISAFSLK
jgi:glucose dehydrogenase